MDHYAVSGDGWIVCDLNLRSMRLERPNKSSFMTAWKCGFWLSLPTSKVVSSRIFLISYCRARPITVDGWSRYSSLRRGRDMPWRSASLSLIQRLGRQDWFFIDTSSTPINTMPAEFASNLDFHKTGSASHSDFLARGNLDSSLGAHFIGLSKRKDFVSPCSHWWLFSRP